MELFGLALLALTIKLIRLCLDCPSRVRSTFFTPPTRFIIIMSAYDNAILSSFLCGMLRTALVRDPFNYIGAQSNLHQSMNKSVHKEINPLNLTAGSFLLNVTCLFKRTTQNRIVLPMALFIHDRSIRLDYVRAIVSRAHFDKQLMEKCSRRVPMSRCKKKPLLRGLTFVRAFLVCWN